MSIKIDQSGRSILFQSCHDSLVNLIMTFDLIYRESERHRSHRFFRRTHPYRVDETSCHILQMDIDVVRPHCGLDDEISIASRDLASTLTLAMFGQIR